MKELEFITLEEVLAIHEDQITRYGGLHGVRDIGLLESAIAQPIAQFKGRYLHKNIFQMAAAYLYHICLNHPFNDGNKRTALVTMILFLKFNNVILNCSEKDAETLILKVAKKQISKAKISQFIQEHFISE